MMFVYCHLKSGSSVKRRSVGLFVSVSTGKPPPVVFSRRQNGIISLLHRDNLFQFSDNQADILSSADPQAFFLHLLLKKCQNDARLIIRAAPRAHCSLNPSRNGGSGKRQTGIETVENWLQKSFFFICFLRDLALAVDFHPPLMMPPS